MWVEIVMKVARKFSQKQWRRKDGQRTDATTQLLLLMELMPLCDSRRCVPIQHTQAQLFLGCSPPCVAMFYRALNI
jgi:thymidylate synthase